MQATVESVRKSVTVEAPIGRAFDVFTNGYDAWWPRSHHIGEADMAKAVLEPRAGGRYYEIGVDGSECDWGRVLEIDAPNRIVFSWHLDGDWQYDPDPEHASEIEVRFTAESATATRVDLEHRNLERHGGEAGEKIRDAVSSEGGWGGLLARFRAQAEQLRS